MAAIGEQRDLSKILPTSWPESCPSVHEEKVITIICGNTHLHWALHDGVGREFMPQLFWRTPALNSDEIRTLDPCSVLERYLPHGGHELIFGAQGAPANKEQAAKTAAERRIPALGVYIVSTNAENEAGIEFLFRDVCCRMHSLKASDFFTKEQGVYEGMGVDRVANVKAAALFYSCPCLVIDGGTALTYTAADAKGNILGGGISPGLAAKFRSLHDFTGALPLISHEDLLAAVKESAETKSPLNPFAVETKKGMIAAGLKELASVCWGAVKSFKASVVDSADPDAMDNGSNKRVTVCLTGGDGDIVEKLLAPDHSSIISVEPGTTNSSDGVVFRKHKHLAHYGIAALLQEKCKEGQATQTKESKVRAEIVGQRVAKKFRVRAEDLTYRGSIAAVTPGKTLEDDWFYVRYDDGDTEHLDIIGLYDALVLYNEIGELVPATSEKGQKKLTEAEETAKLLVEKSETVKQHAATPVSERKSGKKRSAGSSKGAPAGKIAKTSPKKKQDPQQYVGMRVAKYFGDDVFFGTIQKYIAPTNPKDFDLWHVFYDDEDQEDYDSKDLKNGLLLYRKHQAEDTKSKVTAVTEAATGEDTTSNLKPAPVAAPEAASAEPVAPAASTTDNGGTL